MTKWEVGNGQSIKAWTNCWVDSDVELQNFVKDSLMCNEEDTLSTILLSAGEWDWNQL